MYIPTTNRIPDSELRITFARSSGAGGQNVNKTSTKVTIHWSLSLSQVFTGEEKERIRKKLANKLNNNDEIVVSSEEQRSQPQNRASAIERLNMLIAKALYIPKKRKPTKPTYASKLKRLETKKKHSEMKKRRHEVEF